MSINRTIYEPTNLPKYTTPVLIGFGALTYMSLSYFYSNSLPFFATASVGVIGMIVALTRPMWNRPMLWAMIGLIAVIHLVLLISIPLPKDISYGMLFFPFAVMEMFLFWKIIVGAFVRYDRTR